MINNKSLFLLCLTIFGLCHFLYHSIVQKNKFENRYNTSQKAERRSLTVEENIEFPDPQMVLDLSELTVKILDIKSDSNPEDFIPSKYKLHLWIDADYSTEAMVVTTDGESYGNRIIVMFRGSESVEDYLANANVIMEDPTFLPDAPDGVKIHRGYQACFLTENTPQRIEDMIFSLLNNSEMKMNQEIILSGHSLGGTLSHIMAINLASKHPDMNFKVINFGAPRFGNKTLKDWVRTSLSNLTAWRFVYRRDFAPRIISRSFGYTHTGHLYQIGKRGTKVYYDQTGGNGMAGVPGGWYAASSFLQHNSYYRSIKQNIGQAGFWSNEFEKCKWWMMSCWFK